MSAVKIIATLLIIASVLGLMYGGLSYAKETQQAAFGPFELAVKDTRTVNVPVWAGIATLVAGSALLFAASRKN